MVEDAEERMLNKPFLSLVALLVVQSSTGFDETQSKNHVGESIEETGFYQSIRLTSEKPLFEKQSQYQKIEVHNSPYYGKILVLDGVLQLAERDADSYNEMMAHIPMFQHSDPKRVLVIGGGDGYVLSEVLKHKSVERVDHVDLDSDVIDACKDHFSWGDAWQDPRVQLHLADGASFARNAEDGSYDVIIQDSSDPWTLDENGDEVELPSSVLYSDEHFSNIHRILKPDGILNLQAETIQIPSDIEGINEWRQQVLNKGFRSARYGSLYTSSYPTGQIGFLLCEKDPTKAAKYHSIEQLHTQMNEAGRATTYYHPRLQNSSFDLPLWAEKQIYGEDGYKGTRAHHVVI